MTKSLTNLTIPVLNRYDLLQRCIKSIDYPVDHLLIIDNGQDYRARPELPDTIKKMTWLDMPANFGVAASWNLGIKAFRHDPVWFFASNDMEFQPGSVEALAEAADPQALIISEMFPHFHAFAVGEEVVRKAGLADENIYPAFEEDVEWLGRIHRAGVRIAKADVPAKHDNSSTINSSLKYRDANVVTHPENRKYRLRKEAGLLHLTEPKWSIDRWRKQDWR